MKLGAPLAALALMLAVEGAQAKPGDVFNMAGDDAAVPMETLADLRAGLAALYSELRALEDHLAPSGRSIVEIEGNSALERLGSIERELQRVIGKAEELEYRISRIVDEGSERVIGLDRRLCLLEPGCNPAELEVPEGLISGVAERRADAAPAHIGPQVGEGERAAFERGQALLEEGDFLAAEEVFAAHLSTWRSGPLATRVELLRGRALEGSGDMTGAARAYLGAFSADTSGPVAAEALTALGQALAALGQVSEACAALGQVGERFPESSTAIAAAGARAQIDCP